MKSSKIFTEALAATILLTCSACTPRQAAKVAPEAKFTDVQLKALFVPARPNIFVASPALLARVLRTTPLEEQLIPQCNPSPNSTRVIKLRINNNFDLKNTGRDVVSKKSGGNGVHTVPEPTWSVESTTYDLKLDKTVWDSHNQIIAVTIILKDKDLRFPGDKYSVTTVKTADSMFKCLDLIKYGEDKQDADPEDNSDTGKDKWEQATFYVDETKIQAQKFNIRLIVTQKNKSYVIPIILDPVIDNNGFN